MNKYFITDLCEGLKIKVLVEVLSKEEFVEELHDDPDAEAKYDAICEGICNNKCAKIYGAIGYKDGSKEVIERLLQKVVSLHISDDAKEFNNLEEAEKAFEEWKEN